MTALNNEAFEWILAPTALLTPRIILKRINFTPDEFSDLLKKYGFSNNESVMDLHGHGTHIAGITAGVSDN